MLHLAKPQMAKKSEFGQVVFVTAFGQNLCFKVLTAFGQIWPELVFWSCVCVFQDFGCVQDCVCCVSSIVCVGVCCVLCVVCLVGVFKMFQGLSVEPSSPGASGTI